MERSALMPLQICIQCYNSAIRALPFIKLYRDSTKKIASILNSLKTIQIPNRQKSVYILIDNGKIDRFVDTRAKTDARNEERLNNFKERLNRRCREKNVNTKQVNTKFTCPECEKPYKNLYKLNAHMKTIKKKMCHVCKQILSTELFLKHLKGHSVKIYKCKFCMDTFEGPIRFSKHRKKCHKVLSHFCVECKQGFESATNLICHMPVHKPKVCSGCSKKFVSRSCFRNHSERCNPKTNFASQKYVCDYCSKEYGFKNALKVHIMHNHLYGFQFQCEECGKTFSNRSVLSEHGNTHNKVLDRYICNVCGAKYSTRRGYERHSKKHTKPNATIILNDGKGKILQETSVNSNIKYECGMCKMKFCYHKSFKTHLKVKHQVIYNS
ncbi:zinc finger protein 699-like [Galleria mellonella]|uniref:Zinc finger protein 699-like n=1 Tax=Galleria mellonella TaxID=7137 RepID=A0ABM3MW06_GALME|nr:zinc finger protein 699-like [Galleria mellonella]XP_052755543.1 zinc finger protein 699-like [Galleria mellonella]